MAGIVLRPLNTAYTLAELDYFIKDSGARGVVCSSSMETQPKERLGEGTTVFPLDAKGGGNLSQRAEGQPAAFTVAERNDEDLAALLYTSGTTGRSSRAMLSHLNLLLNARALAKLWRFHSEDMLLHPSPIFHTHGLFVACNVSLISQHPRSACPSSTWAMFCAHAAGNSDDGVPTFYTRLLGDGRFDGDLATQMRLLSQDPRRFLPKQISNSKSGLVMGFSSDTA